MKVNGLMISVMDLDFISIQMEIFMKELFPKDKSKVLEFKNSKMGIFIEENIKMINLKVKVCTYGEILHCMKVNSNKGEEMDKAFGNHRTKLMLKFTKVNM